MNTKGDNSKAIHEWSLMEADGNTYVQNNYYVVQQAAETAKPKPKGWLSLCASLCINFMLGMLGGWIIGGLIHPDD